MTASANTSFGFDPQRLDAWLRASIPGVEGEMTLQPIAGGQSNPTFFVTYPTRRMVLRKKPSAPVLPSAHAVDREHRIMDAPGPTGVPLPRMPAYHAEPDVDGRECGRGRRVECDLCASRIEAIENRKG